MKPSANIMLNGEKLKFFSKIRNKTMMPSLTNLIQHNSGSSAREVRQKKERKGNQMGKEEVKVSHFANDMSMYKDNPID